MALYHRSKVNRSNLVSTRSNRLPMATRHNRRKATRSEEGPFGAMLANEVFDLWQGQDLEDCTSYDGDDERYEPVEEQLDLPLENLSELEARLRIQIQKFEVGYERMMVYALQWFHLQEECEENPQVAKLFRDMQMIRKLHGSDAV